MADENKNNNDDEVVVAEYKISMYCNGCERDVVRAISKVQGVEKFMTDMNEHKVTVIGKMCPNKVLKKLKKRTGKKVEMLVQNDGGGGGGDTAEEGEVEEEEDEGILLAVTAPTHMFMHACCVHPDTLTIFSDENPNACSLM